ncbi:ferritin ribonucleotide reductase-like protein [Diplodia corticola]|uniref:Ferritin ribonucleotide reductase-like protein n=1 Tax=Diplodia corticola TaxID=236234 RepID=A0A1J9QY03_9PEZI|nr:ferritin ribonucleotide reductase-like protein [Diplodia corticola]OJD33918.1 ferritin ribonucleotide reductase-like protein [Diplodia corticola]
MKYTAAVAALAGLSAAAPTKRMSAPTDADILQYALTLEHLENAFYKEGLSNYTEADFKAAGYDSTFYNNIKTVGSDESSHVDFLTKGLTAAGATPVEPCTYAFGATDVKTFLATAAILEGVGVSAYLGAAADIMSKTYLTAAGSILTVEARHASYIRGEIKQSPFPQAFDDPLSLNEVYTLAAQFITSCPTDNAPLPVKAFPTLVASSEDATIKKGSTVMLSTPGYEVKAADGVQIYGAFITVTGPVVVEAKSVDGGFTVEVPEGVNGQSYVVLTGCKDAVTDDTVAAGPAIVEITN